MSAALETASQLLKALDRAGLLEIMNLAEELRDLLAAERERAMEIERRKRHVKVWPAAFGDGRLCNVGRGCLAIASHNAAYWGGGRKMVNRVACDAHADGLVARGAERGEAVPA